MIWGKNYKVMGFLKGPEWCFQNIGKRGSGDKKRIKGIVTTINRTAREIKLSTAAGEWEWIKMKDIISVY